MLTLQTIRELQNEQQKLDEFITQKKNLTDIKSENSFIRTKVALLVEIGELANELATFKH
jgi:dimeric dUTPase (all-alpha-NTP-PPase superfamily)